MTAAPAQTPRLHVEPPLLEGPGEPVRLGIELPAGLPEHTSFAIDLYDGGNAVHPEGHLGRWAMRAPGGTKVAVTLDLGAAGADRVRLEPPGFAPPWINDAIAAAEVERVDVHVILQHEETDEVFVDRVVPWLRTGTALARYRAARRALEATPAWIDALAAPPELPGVGCVHLVSVDLRAGDAVGNLALDTARWLRRHGLRCRLWARNFDASAIGWIEDAKALPEHAGADDLVLHQHSIFDPDLDTLLALPCAKLGFFQGVTPPELLAPVDPAAAEVCRRGLEQLPRLAGFDALLAGSAAIAAVLREALGASDVGVAPCPPTLNLGRFDGLAPEPVSELPGERFLLYVGRLAPHKRIEDLLEISAALRAIEPGCTLVLAGSWASPAYRARIESRLHGDVRVIERPSDGQLATLYRGCAAYVSASEHEGFCVPPVEAMGFRKPVFARDVAAVRETLDGAGVLFAPGDARRVAEAIARVLGSETERAALLAAQDARYEALRRAADGAILARAMERAWARGRERRRAG